MLTGHLLIIFYLKDRAWKLNLPQPEFLSKLNKKSDLSGAAVSPIPGVVDKILVSPNDVVKKGDALLIIVAMKMEVCDSVLKYLITKIFNY